MISIYFSLFLISLASLLFIKAKSIGYKIMIVGIVFILLSAFATVAVLYFGDKPPENSRIIQLQ